MDRGQLEEQVDRHMIGRKKAVSTIVGTVLMINISIAMGIAYWLWASGMLSTFMSQTQSQYTLLEDRKDEAIVIENVLFITGAPKTIAIFVRNVGTREAVISAVYVNGVSVTTTPSLPQTLYVSGNLTLTVTLSWSYASSYFVTVATSKGNQAKGEWVA
jgi:FlaG/FlaF family flagellin (archaellin)